MLRTAFVIAASVLATVSLVWAASSSPGAPPDIVWHDKAFNIPTRGEMFQGPDAELLNQDCVICHSAMFVKEQPALPAATWRAEVLKMKNVFGAPVDEKDVSALVKALVAQHGTASESAPAGDPGGGG